jgi:hypothetical protein
MVRVLIASANIFLSLIFGALCMGAIWYLAPEHMQQLFMYASGVKAWIVGLGLPAKYNNFLWFLIEEKQLVYMGFVMITRIALAVLVAVVAWWMTRRHPERVPRLLRS